MSQQAERPRVPDGATEKEASGPSRLLKSKPDLRSAIDFLTGENEVQPAGQKEFPGFFSFVRQHWRSSDPQAPASEGLLARYRRLTRSYEEAKVHQAESLRTYEAIAQETRLNKEFLSLLFASCLVATFGLFQASMSALIAAEILAPLMMPLLGFSLAVIWGDRLLLWRAVGTLGIGSLMVIALSAVLSLITPGVEMNHEIVARTNPTLYDILIALVSGWIAAYAYVNPRISPAISGVAVAHTSVPPLCTIGIALGQHDPRAALGALLLFLCNLVSVSLAASFVFWRMRIHPATASTEEVGARASRNVGLSLALLLLIAAPLGYFMHQTYVIKHLTTEVRELLQHELPDSEVLSLNLRRFGKEYDLRCVVITSRRLSGKDVVNVEARIRKALTPNSKVKLLAVAAGGK